jgi:glycosyltransferase involved in cell wall biosynthesis
MPGVGGGPSGSLDDAAHTNGELPLTVIEPRSGWQVIGFRELWRFRELLYFLTDWHFRRRYVNMEAGAVSLSVIIPTYNRSEFVRKCLISLRQSGVPDLEIVVVDDGSTDDTAEVVVATHPGAIYLSQKNSGPAAARNRGFRLSRGRYVAFLDCDDEWLPEAPAGAIALLDRHPEVDLLFADARMGNRDDGFTSWIESGGQAEFFQLPHRELEPGFRLMESGPLFRRMALRNPVFIGAVVMRREAFAHTGMFDAQLCGAADWNLWLRMAGTTTFAYWHEPLAIYIKHVDGMSNDLDGMRKEFCMALRKLPVQVSLTPVDQAWVAEQLRHHLFSYAYRAFNRGEYVEARKRFADLLQLSGWEARGFLYWAACHLPFGMPGWVRKLKRSLVWTSSDQPPQAGASPRSKAALSNRA